MRKEAIGIGGTRIRWRLVHERKVLYKINVDQSWKKHHWEDDFLHAGPGPVVLVITAREIERATVWGFGEPPGPKSNMKSFDHREV